MSFSSHSARRFLKVASVSSATVALLASAAGAPVFAAETSASPSASASASASATASATAAEKKADDAKAATPTESATPSASASTEPTSTETKTAEPKTAEPSSSETAKSESATPSPAAKESSAPAKDESAIAHAAAATPAASPVATATATPVAPAPTQAPVAETVAPQPANTAVEAPAVKAAAAEQPTEWSYENCADVRAKLGREIYRGEPGYALKLDRDRDGIGCDNEPAAGTAHTGSNGAVQKNNSNVSAVGDTSNGGLGSNSFQGATNSEPAYYGATGYEAAGSSTDTLAYTGSNAVVVFGGGLALLALGVVTIFVARRRA
ncbi:MAG: excalibur calcium-binding domain-containing protein [Rothia sp. (in: high G+C Gram-positive bacteria)]|nr:excalibur calcium-binding domain-containing protein [Rothia sp. (in: high G+C Gram-positive bacteria)]